MDIFSSQGDFFWSFLSFWVNSYKAWFSSHNVVVISSCVLFTFNLDVNEVSVGLVESLVSGIEDLIVLSTFNRVFGNDRDGLLESFDFWLSEDFFSVQSNFRVVVLFIVDLAHADSITTLVVDKDEPLGTFSADVAKNVILAT